jgi:CrcB protein
MNSLAVGIGGIVGALLRFGMSAAFNPSDPSRFPWGTLLCNYAGCLLLGFLASLTEGVIAPRVKLGLTTGVIGAFTTFSTFSVDVLHLLQAGKPALAATYALSSMWGGLALAWLGVKCAAVSARSPKGGAA